MIRQLIKRDHKEAQAMTNDRLKLAIIVMLLAVIGCAMWAAVPLAKYANATSSSDSARVAQFAVTPLDGTDSNDIKLNYTNNSQTYAFTVSNVRNDTVVNEVTTAYDVILTFPSKLESYVTVKLANDNGASGQTATVSSDGLTYTFKDAGKFTAATARTDTLTLTFSFDTTDSVDKTWEGITLKVKATQVD